MRLGLLLAALLMAAPAARAQSFGSPSRFTEQSGEAIYNSVCAGCHMADARGAVGAGAYPSLRQDERLVVAGYPIAVLLHGQRAMPSFARTLSDRQIADVVDYLRTHFGNDYRDVPTEADVKAARE